METARLDSRPQDAAKCYSSLVQGDLQASKLVESNPSLSETARRSAGLCDTARCQLCYTAGQYRDLPEAELCNAARATWRVNAPSPLVDSKGQWALLGNNKDAVGLRTPTATVQVLCATPRAEDSEAGHLLELVRVQAVTRQEAKEAT